jgi:hypothetical protein
MTLQALSSPRFVRRTQLGPGEYRKNFRQIDGDVISAVTSREADRVTPLMSKIYLRLVHAPTRYWERDGVLRFEGELRDDGHVTAWAALCEVLGVASATAGKALRWMHEQGIVGYFAGKNGVGIRVFINRAVASIGSRAGQKILEFPRASSEGVRTSRNEAAFSDSYADLEVSDKDLNPRAPKSGAVKPEVVKPSPTGNPVLPDNPHPAIEVGKPHPVQTALRVEVVTDEIVSRLKRELGPSLDSAARRAAAQEHERTREWLENRGLPKAARVAQREAYNVLRQHGLIDRSPGNAAVGRGPERPELTCYKVQPLTMDEISELAQACVAMLEVHGRPLDVTLAEMGVEAGGFLSPADVPKVRELAESMARDGRPEGRHNESHPGSKL